MRQFVGKLLGQCGAARKRGGHIFHARLTPGIEFFLGGRLLNDLEAQSGYMRVVKKKRGNAVMGLAINGFGMDKRERKLGA
jgi:hypothetical protein